MCSQKIYILQYEDGSGKFRLPADFSAQYVVGDV